MKSRAGFGWIGRSFAQLAMACIIAGPGAALAAGPGFEGRVFGVDEGGKLLGTVAGATIKLKGGGTATSDGAGRYRIDVAPGTYQYKLTAAGYKDEDSGRGVQLQLSEGYAVFNFTLTKGKTDPEKKTQPPQPLSTGRLHGNVYEKTPEGNRGIGGAIIALRRAMGRNLARVVTRGGGKTGDGAGAYEVGLQEGEWRASVTADGFEQLVDPKPIQIPPGGEATRDFILRREADATDQGLDITVRVIPGDGKPIPFSAVRVGITEVPGNEPVGKEVPPDGKGKLRTPLPVGRYHAYAEAEGFETAHSRPTFVFAGRFSRILLTLERASTEPEGGLLVVVTDAATKKPLPGASVLARKGQEALADAARGTTGPNGEVGMGEIGAGSYAVLARLAGYKPGGSKVDVQSGKRHRVVIPLTPEGEPSMVPTTPVPEPVPPEPGLTQVPVAKTQCPVVRTQCPTAVTKCPPTQTQCQVVTTECPVVPTECPIMPGKCPTPMETRDPKAQTHCPVVQTRCPLITTRCPPTQTQCQTAKTECPVVSTQCPIIPGKCPPPVMTRDPIAKTKCPEVPTQCPVVTTECPATPTRCQDVKTQCPSVKTQCPSVKTLCPSAKTKCPACSSQTVPMTEIPLTATRVPVVQTQCPAVQTQCPRVTTKCPPCQGITVPRSTFQVLPQGGTSKSLTVPMSVPTRTPAVQTRCPAVKTKCPPCQQIR